MPSSSDKPTNTVSGKASGAAKGKPKANQSQTAKTDPQAGKETEADDVETPRTSERKTSSKVPTSKDSKVAPAVPRAEGRVRKLTPQQQLHVARARRRRRNQRLGLGVTAVLVIVVITVVAWQVITKNAETTRLENLHSAGTATAAARATATENVLAPAVPPVLTATPTKTSDGLQYIDIKVGTGNAVKEGDTISVQYTGWVQSTQVKFDSSYDDNKDGKPTQFTLVGPDQNGVIKGWVEGVSGMKPGGERRLIIPPDLAYGKDGSPPLIPANATLIFDIQLVSIDNSATPTPTPTPGS